jgi:hypothetical protein
MAASVFRMHQRRTVICDLISVVGVSDIYGRMTVQCGKIQGRAEKC